jgi:hypothetical protein
MKDKTKRALRAFALAPLAPGLLIGILGGILDGDYRPISFFGCLVGCGCFTYPLTLLVGLPAYLLINRYATLRCAHVLAISGLTGAATAVSLSADATALLFSVALGLSAGLAFWLLWRRPGP